MGKEKRLFLLAVMTVMMSTVGYGAKIHEQFNRVKDQPDVVQKSKEETFTVENKEDTGYRVTAGQGEKDKTNIESYANITVENGVGIKLDLGEKAKGKINVTNKGTIKVNNGVGVNLVTNEKNSNKGATNTFINEGTIKVADGKGIQLNNEKDVVTNNNEIIVDKDTNGIGVSMSAGNFTNSETGKITVGKDGIGIEQSGGTSKNEGTITVSGGIGIKQENGVSTNNGMIDVKSGAGVEITNGTFTNGENGEIIVSAGTGIKSLGGTTTNAGKITVNGGTGVTVRNEFTNRGTITINNEKGKGKGIYLSTGGTVKNDGTITVSGGTGIDQRDGTLNNNRKINVTNGTGISLVKGTFNNNGSGENGLHVSGSGNVGINQTGGTGNNTGLIKVEDGATGIELSNGTFNNNGIKDEKDKVVSLGKMEVSGAGTIGINQTGGTFNNFAVIEVKNGATGVKLSNGTFNNDVIKDKEEKKILSYSEINVSGKNSIGLDISAKGELSKVAGSINVSEGATGIRVNQGTKNTINYNGIIDVKQGTGVEVLGGTFVTKKTVLVQDGTGIKLSGGAVNNSTTGKIDVQGQGTGVDITGGKFTNKNIVNVGKGNGAGVKVNGGTFINERKVSVYSGTGIDVINGEFTNKKNIADGKEEEAIYVSAGTGINIEKDGKVLNEGKINVAGGNGIGVALNDSMFVNLGEIFGKGTAIQSIKGNNTVYLKNGSNVAGKIVGADGIDVLGLEKGTYSDLDISNYEAITVRDGIVIVKDSTIELEYNKGTKEYLKQAKKDMDEYDNKNKKAVEEKKLTMSNSNLIIDFKDSLTNPNGPNGENPIIDVGTDGKLTFGEGMKIDFSSSDGRDIFNLNEALGLGKDQIVVEGNFA